MKALERARGARHERAADLARELSTFVSERAPGLTREDVGALVAELVPRELEQAPSWDAEANAQRAESSQALAQTVPDARRAIWGGTAATWLGLDSARAGRAAAPPLLAGRTSDDDADRPALHAADRPLRLRDICC